MKPIITTLCAILLAISGQVAGQNLTTSFATAPLPGQPPFPVGGQVRVDLNVTNFLNISSVLMPITYNSTVLRFDSITDVAIPEFVDVTPASHPTPGVIKIAWFPSLVNYPDGFPESAPALNGRLMRFHFTVMANGVTAINLSTSVPFTPIEVVNASGNVVFNNTIFNSSGSSGNGVSVTGGVAPPPSYTGFKIIGTTVYAKQGGRVCVPVSVNDFDNIQLLQFAMHWDNTKITYECVRGAAAPIVPTFNAPAAAPGTLLMQWEDPNLLSGTGVTRPDLARIYEVCFNVIGQPGNETNITFDGFGFGFPPDFTTQFAEATNSMGNNVWVNASTPVNSKVIIMPDPAPTSAVTYTVDHDVVGPNAQTTVDVKVKNFITVSEAEFVLTYDATKLTFNGPVVVAPTAMNLNATTNFTHAVNGGVGTLKFHKWTSTTGVTLPDNTTIFSVNFTATGAAGSVVPINFVTTSCPNPVVYSTMQLNTGGTTYKHEAGSVTIQSQIPIPQATAVNTLCNIGATGSINLNPNGTAISYAWTGPGGFTSTNQNLTNLAVGTYNVTVTYSAGTATASATVSAPTAVSATHVATAVNCFGDSNGSVDLTPSGGTGPYTYAWQGPGGFTSTSQDINGIQSGNVICTVTDANGCLFITPLIQVGSPQPIMIPSGTIVITGVSCFGGINGAVSISPIGGTPPYTYDWSNDGPENPDNDPQNLSGLTAGTFVPTVTDSKGCSFVYPGGMTVTAPAQLVTNLVKKTDVKCFNSPSGTAEITVAGGTGNKTYSWRRASDNMQVSTAQNPTDLLPGTYNVIVTDGAGCTSTLPNSVIIVNAPGALAASETTTPGLCFGQSTGSIDLTVTGGWGAFGYDWPAPLPDSIQDQPAVSSGTYTVTISDQGGCTITRTITVAGAQSAIQSGAPVVTTVSCFGQGNGGICITPSGGNGAPYSVSWSNTTLVGSCIGSLQVGSYAPTVTDGQGCTAVFPSVLVSGPATPISLDTTLTPANPLGGITVITTGGTPTYTYLWSTGATTPGISNQPAGTYTVTVTDANNCTMVGTFAIPSANVLNTPTYTVQSSCNNDGCIFLTLPAGASVATPFTISWNGGGTQSSSLTPSLCNLAADFYNVTITAANGNSVTLNNIEVQQKQQALLSTANIVHPIDDFHNGSLSVMPQFPNCTVLWSTGSTALSLNNLDQGNYSVTITNNTSQCTAVYSYTLERQYPPFVASVVQEVDPTCGTSNNGFINITVNGGDGPNYTYQWSGPNGFVNSSKDISNLAPGSYTCTVSDERDSVRIIGPIVLTSNSNLNITNVNELSLTPGGTQVSGDGICDGVAQVVIAGATGNVNILWSNGVTTANNNTLCGGQYSVTVTDSQGCTASWSDALTSPAAIASSSQATSPKCYGQTNGTAKVFVSGGIEPYEVLWSNGQFDELVFSNTFSEAVSLEGGEYGVTITDGNGVTRTMSVTVPAPQPIEVEFTSIDPERFNDCDGERIAFVTGAQAPLLYAWTSSKSGQTGENERAEGLCAGDVLTYLIQDANGCSVTVIDTVPYPEDGCFRVRPVLTPAEQDGNNDFTNITCIETVRDNMEIYNRWGQLVFQTEEYSNDPNDPARTFTGFTRTGQSLPEGVYYYVLTIVDEDGIQHQFKGHINIIK
ncbi:MAG: gliding motility-associated C-terminal domain-containing protein [Saprospiraceae bacterium]|nr:gliding motility-associated C-terminal domain-containing protein [Saprospiraceae bacterium]